MSGVQPWLTYIAKNQYGGEPDGVQRLAGDVAKALNAIVAGVGLSSFQLPVTFYNGTPPGPTQTDWYFDSNTALPGWTAVWMAQANASAPVAGNVAIAWKNDGTVMQIGSSATALLAIPVETEFTATVVFGGELAFSAGSFLVGDSNPVSYGVSTLIDLSAGGTIVVPAGAQDSPILRFSGALPSDTTIELLDHVGAVWDLDFSDLSFGTSNLVVRTTAPIVAAVTFPPTILSGARVACTATGNVVCFGSY